MAYSDLFLNGNVGSVKLGTSNVKIYFGEKIVYPTYKVKLTLNDGSVVFIPYDENSTSSITRSEIDNAVSATSSITDVEISTAVKTVDSGTFSDIKNISGLTIGSGVIYIGSGAFAGQRVENLVVPDNVQEISSGGFADAYVMKTAVFGTGLTIVGGTLLGSSNRQVPLESITFKSTVPPTATYPDFLDHTDDCPIYVPSGSVNDYKTAQYWDAYASRIQAIPSGNNAWDAAIK